MRLSYAISLLPLAASVGALQVTSPKKGEDVDLSKSFTVKWDAVDTDPSSFDLYIVNNAVYPSVEQKIASDVDSSKGSYDVSGLSDLTNGKGYQINFLSNSAKNSGILAQSQQFNVEGSSESTSTASASESKTTTAATALPPLLLVLLPPPRPPPLRPLRLPLPPLASLPLPPPPARLRPV
ncbi:hypothetical protein AO1008_09765 [Aspergillus oryzae 100-8]|nr:hypothetical protein AO1008_09765 [Aspergillus oryzae 100-8]